MDANVAWMVIGVWAWGLPAYGIGTMKLQRRLLGNKRIRLDEIEFAKLMGIRPSRES